MRKFAALIALLLAGTVGAQDYQAIVDDPRRPASDREDDARRKPVAVMAFSGVATGDVVLEIGAGRGYTTELLSRIVGGNGRVYAHRLDPTRVIGNRLPNVTILPNEPEDIAGRLQASGLTHGSVDRIIAFFSLHDAYLGEDFDSQHWYGTLLKYLKPGGDLVVLDNAAESGSGLAAVADLHRIDEEFLKGDIVRAGFVFVGATDVLRNPDDDPGSSWFEDTETRKAGYQDRFAFKFRKP